MSVASARSRARSRSLKRMSEFWMPALHQLPPDQEVQPGMTAAQMIEYHAVPDAPDGYRWHPDVVFGRGGDRELRLWMYAPEDTSTPLPAVVFVHGGAWHGGH